MERHLRLLSPCMTAIPPITLPAAPTLFQSTFTFPPTVGQPAARPGPRPCRLLQVASMSPGERDHFGHGGDDSACGRVAGPAAAAVRTWMRFVRAGLPYLRRETRRAV